MSYYKKYPEITYELDGGGDNAYHITLYDEVILDLNDLEHLSSLDSFEATFEAGLKAGYAIAKTRSKTDPPGYIIAGSSEMFYWHLAKDLESCSEGTFKTAREARLDAWSLFVKDSEGL